MTSLGCPSTVTKINDGEQSLRSTAPDLPRGFATSIVEMLWPSIPPISRMSISRSLRSRPRVLKDGRFSYASGFSPWKFPIPLLRRDDVSWAPHGALLLSGNRTSRFRLARVSCPQDLRNVDPRLSSDF
jgi:hypothetical protein